MSAAIERQLKKLQFAKPIRSEKDPNKVFFRKIESLRLEVDSCYLIRLGEGITHPNSSSTVAANWNGGRVPPHDCYKCDVEALMAGMAKIQGLAYDEAAGRDLDDMWEGWVPIDELTVISKI